MFCSHVNESMEVKPLTSSVNLGAILRRYASPQDGDGKSWPRISCSTTERFLFLLLSIHNPNDVNIITINLFEFWTYETLKHN